MNKAAAENNNLSSSPMLPSPSSPLCEKNTVQDLGFFSLECAHATVAEASVQDGTLRSSFIVQADHFKELELHIPSIAPFFYIQKEFHKSIKISPSSSAHDEKNVKFFSKPAINSSDCCYYV
jgi:hypothetical protein